MKMPSQIISNKTKKKIKVSIRIIILLALSACVFEASKIRNITHLSDSDLKWVDCYETGDSILFKSSEGNIDTMVISNIKTLNSTFPFRNPILNFETSSDYNAMSTIYFCLCHDCEKIKCRFFMIKEKQDESPLISWSFGNMISKGFMPYGYRNCIIGDSLNSRYGVHDAPSDSLLYVKSFEWCKGIGLKSYTLRNGETFTLMSK